jgi:serine/threonine-protein phosphatase 2B regulatory subunit
MDVDKGGSIDLGELLSHLEIPKTPFARRVFGVLDKDGSGDISFEEFVCITTKYGTLE